MNRIITAFHYPPIPDREHDWCAYREDDVEDVSKYAWARTEEKAIHNLLEDEAERLEELHAHR